jgi:hypothetical protein
MVLANDSFFLTAKYWTKIITSNNKILSVILVESENQNTRLVFFASSLKLSWIQVMFQLTCFVVLPSSKTHSLVPLLSQKQNFSSSFFLYELLQQQKQVDITS